MDKSNVGIYIFIILAVSAKSSSPEPKVAPQSTPTDVSILNQLENDQEICPTSKKFFPNSLYVRTCGTIKYRPGDVKLNESTVDEFLCLGIYDTSYRICMLGINHHEINITSAQEFDTKLNKTVASKDYAEKFCEHFNKMSYPSIYNVTKKAVDQLMDALNKEEICYKICMKFDGTISPLCSAISFINSQFLEDRNNILINLWSEKKQKLLSKDDVNFKSSADNVKSLQEHNNEYTVKINMDTQKTPPTTNSNGSKSTTAKNNANSVLPPEESKPSNEDIPKMESDLSSVPEGGPRPLSELKPEIPAPDNSPQSSPVQPVSDSIAPHPVDTKVSNSSKSTDTLAKPQLESVEKEDVISENTQPHGDSQEPNMQNNEDIGSNEEMDSGKYTDQNDVMDIQKEQEVISNLQPPEPAEQKIVLPLYHREIEDESHFFVYFMAISLLCVGGYVGYHNKQKILAIVLEGRRSRGGRGRRRPSTTNYSKLNCTLEEAVTSQCDSNVTHVIY